MISKKGTLTNLKKTPDGKENYDSALEREYMVELERDSAVARWTKKHGIRIPYKVFGFPHNYLPDFLVESIKMDTKKFTRQKDYRSCYGFQRK